MYLPAKWTQRDQEIIEALLFDSQAADSVRYGESESHQILRYRSLLARQIASERRKSKHREVQRRFTQRKKEQVGRVKEQLQRLEKQFDLLQADNERKKLKEENEVLLEEVDKRGSPPCPTQEQVQLMLANQQKLIRDHHAPLTGEEWDELLWKKLLEFESSSCETKYESTGAIIMGWSDRRNIDFDKGTTRFVMTKRFAHLNAQEFCTTTYGKLRKPETHPKLFHPAMTLRMQPLQEIDTNGVVLHRCMLTHRREESSTLSSP